MHAQSTLTRTIVGAAALLAALATTPAAAALIRIDTFAQTAQDLTATKGGGLVTSNLAAPEAIGGWRRITAEVLGTSPPSGRVEVETAATDQALQISNSIGSRSLVNVIWDSNGLGLNSPGGFDITDGGTNKGLIVRLPLPIDGAMDLGFVFTDILGGMSEFSALFADGSSGESFLPFFTFSAFHARSGSNAADLTRLTSIQMTVTAPEGDGGADTLISLVESSPIAPVPVPAPLALLGVGLTALIAGRRRQRG